MGENRFIFICISGTVLPIPPVLKLFFIRRFQNGKKMPRKIF
jgi:hypothetical protein